jgi:hypothetical protein
LKFTTPIIAIESKYLKMADIKFIYGKVISWILFKYLTAMVIMEPVATAMQAGPII